jgi:Protein of unknown function (DUF998)
MIAVVVHCAVFVILHLLQPHLSVSTSLISDYAATEHRFLTSVAYLAFATVWFALARALGRITLVPLATITLARLLFVIAGVTIVLAAFDPMATDPRHRDSLGAMRTIMTRFARPGLFVGVVLVSLGVRRLPGWEDIAPKLTAVAAAALVVFVATIALLLNAGLGGIGQRLLFLLIYAWVLLFAGRLVSLTRQP